MERQKEGEGEAACNQRKKKKWQWELQFEAQHLCVWDFPVAVFIYFFCALWHLK